MYCDSQLDNEVHNVYEECTRFDRTSNSAPMLTNVFPSGKLSDIKDEPLMEEPAAVAELITRIKDLGDDNFLYKYVGPLQNKVDESNSAIKTYDDLNGEEALLAVQEEICQRKLRDQYRLNYLHALEKMGKANTEPLFPAISGGKAPKQPAVPVETGD